MAANLERIRAASSGQGQLSNVSISRRKSVETMQELRKLHVLFQPVAGEYACYPMQRCREQVTFFETHQFQWNEQMSQPPKRFTKFLREYEDVGAAYKSLGSATMAAGPLPKKTAQLVKLGIAVGMRHEGAVHAHCRKALGAGCTTEEIHHAVLLATTTLGFPGMMAALSWVDDIIDEQEVS